MYRSWERTAAAVLIETMHLFVSGRFSSSLFSMRVWLAKGMRMQCCLSISRHISNSQQVNDEGVGTSQSRTNKRRRRRRDSPDNRSKVEEFINIIISDQTIVVGWNWMRSRGRGRYPGAGRNGCAPWLINFIANFSNVFMPCIFMVVVVKIVATLNWIAIKFIDRCIERVLLGRL